MKQSVECLPKKQAHEEREIIARSYLILERRVICRLLEVAALPPEYLLEVRLDGEVASEAVGSDFLRAASLFELVSRGRVTPCTLKDVVEDMGDAREIFAQI